MIQHDALALIQFQSLPWPYQ